MLFQMLLCGECYENVTLEGVQTIHRSTPCLLVRVPGYRSRGPVSIPGATRFSEKQWFWNGLHVLSGSVLEIREYGRRGTVTLSTWRPRSAKIGTNFADKSL
jgi:hypothetical protein